MTSMLSLILLAAATITPTKGWFLPGQPITIDVAGAGGDATLVLTNFAGGVLDPSGAADVPGGEAKGVDLRKIFPQLDTPGTYVLYVTKKGGVIKDFVATPLVIEVRDNRKRGAPPGPMVVRVRPLEYAVIHTEPGDMTLAFYYDVAPNTVESFLSLAREGYFDGILFHRIVKDFVLQAGDPLSHDAERAGTGGPGYLIDAEFNDRPHVEGALSMARSGDPAEGAGMMPRSDYANSAGSQFFICLNPERTKVLDRKYTVFGKVTSGMDVAHKLEQVPVTNDEKTRPLQPQPIKSVEVKLVTAAENPYAELFAAEGNEK